MCFVCFIYFLRKTEFNRIDTLLGPNLIKNCIIIINKYFIKLHYNRI